MSRMFVVGFVCSALSLGFLAARAQGEELRVRCEWWPPPTGSTPVRYLLQVEELNTGRVFPYTVPHVGVEARIPQVFIFEEGDWFQQYRARVQAVDGQAREGDWSSWSVIYVFEAPEPPR